MKIKRIMALVFTLCIMLPLSVVKAEHTNESNYIYDFWGMTNKSLPAFEYVRTIDNDAMGDIKLSGINDVCVGNNRIFLVDTTESRINIFDTNYNFIISLKLIRDDNNKIVVTDGEQLMLQNPEGVFLSEGTGELYITDTGAERIIVLDGQDYHFKRIIERPSNMVTNDTVFRPSKIVVDQSGRIFTIVQGSHEGIIEINEDGSFSRFFGVNKPKVSVIDYFWKSIATEQQQEKMGKTYAPSYSNIDVDPSGFIYATTYDAASQDMVFRFNAKGENVLLEEGYYPVIGDLTRATDMTSKFVDIAVSDYGVYALLDKEMGRVFVYNFRGDLINIFNKSGNLKGNTKNPTGIAWIDQNLIITDSDLGCAFIFQPTEFGDVILNAENQYFQGNWDEASKLFEEAARLNTNYDLAYVGMGRNSLMNDEAAEAMYYFKLGNDRKYYSKAYKYHRNIQFQNKFVWFFSIFVIVAIAIFYSEYRYNKKST